MIIPQVGQLLYRGCSCDEFAEIIKIENNLMDIKLVDGSINELISNEKTCQFNDPSSSCDEDCEDIDHNLNSVHVELPKNTPVIIKNIPFKSLNHNSIRLWINSANDCQRCMSIFYPHNPGEDVRF